MNGEDETQEQVVNTWWESIKRALFLKGVTANTPQHPTSGKYHPPATIVGEHAKVGAGLAATQAAAVAGSVDRIADSGIIMEPEKDIEAECDCGGGECEECKAKQPTTTTKEEHIMTRSEIINHLTTNCDCWKGGAETLNALTDPQLVAIKQNADKVKAFEPVVSNMLTVAKANGAPATLTADKLPEFVTNAFPPKKKGGKAEDKKDGGADDDEEDDTTDNTNSKRLSMNQWRETAPPEVVQAFDAAREVVQNETQSLVQRLTANVAEGEREDVAKVLAGKSVADLRLMAKLLPPVRNQQQAYQPLSIFAGAQGGPVGNSGKPAPAYEPGDGLEIPTLVGNFAAEREAELKQQRA